MGITALNADDLKQAGLNDGLTRILTSLNATIDDLVSAKLDTTGKDTANGYAGLDGSGKLSTGVIPPITNSMLAGSIAAAKLVGTDIATVGTVGAGMWQGTKVGLAYGGTNADLSATGAAGGVVMQLSTGADPVVNVRPYSVLLNCGAGTTSVSVTAPPAGAQEFFNSGNHGFRGYEDLAGFTQYRVIVHFNAWVASAKVMMRGSVSGGAFHNMESVTDATNAAAATYASQTVVAGAWTNLDATYRVNNVTLTPYTISGDGSTALTLRSVRVQFR